ncbi:Tyrosine decarboxylase 1 [Trametes pubescens]|uniref:Tyrosine decarboxylase 1 n=1 Tax=Trametes pubescens TaxID=154538 RepID=A0A1M2V3J7_TRAPU|nr:Tyrosine decarboxylase 1 [Trametes pubescens]
MDIEEFRKAGYQAIDRICDYYASFQDRPVVSQVQPGYLVDALPSDPPEDAEDFNEIADDFQKLILPGITNWQHPNFFAYFPTAGSFEGILGDLYASSVSNPGFNWLSSPACTELEQVVMDWCAKLLGLGDHFLNKNGVGGGVIQTTASEAAIVVCAAARARYVREHPDAKLEDLVIYTTTQTHSLGVKAGLVLGLAVRALEVTPEDEFSLRGETLRLALAEDLAQGKRPFITIGTVGTTSSGAVDNLEEIGEVLKERPSIWLHVDAAWAGVAMACPEYRAFGKLEPINRYATSYGTNFHKWGLVNFDASMLWVRNRRDLTDALDVTPEFLRTKQHDSGLVIDYRNWHLGLGRRFRSLKVWFVLRRYGVEGFRTHIREGIALNEYLVSLIRASPSFELVTTPSLALSVFRLVLPASPALASGEDALTAHNELNRAFHRRVEGASDKIFLTQTVLNGTFCIRFAVGAQRTRREHIDQAWEVIRSNASTVTEEWVKSRISV